MTNRRIAGVVIMLALIVAAGAYALYTKPVTSETQTDAAMETGVETAQMTQDEAEALAPAAGSEKQSQATESATAAAAEDAAVVDSGTVDVEQALSQRALGDEDAPVVIQEFASLSCSHCAHFHEESFDKIKEEYVDTGKVRFIFTDFPLNAAALDGSMVARCMPEDKYFKFISFLFETQQDWAFGGNHRKALEQNAKLLGATDEMIEACLASEELRKGLVERMQTASEAHNIRSTPSFLFNGEDLVTGAQPYSAFQEKIEALLEESNATE